MARTVVLQRSYSRAMKQDYPRAVMPQGAVWNLIDYLPDLGAPARKRGGWSYGSDNITLTKGTAAYVAALAFAEFAAGAKLVAIDEDGELYTINTSTNAVTDRGAALAPLQKPVLHGDKLIIPGNDGTTAPKYYDGNTTIGNLAGSPPAGKYAAVYKDRTVLAGASAQKTRAYFSGAGDPTSWDTTNSWESVLSPITALAALPNALLIFQNRVTSRVRGSIPPPGSDMIVDDPIFNVGCTDARSVTVAGAFCVFANPLGVYISNGTNLPEDLTASVGLKKYWVELLSTYDASTWTLAGGMYRNLYFISVMNGSTYKDAFWFDLESRTGGRIANLTAVMFASAVTVGEELYFGLRDEARVGKLSTIFSPAAGVKNDADGTAVTPVIEYGFFRDRPGKKTWRTLYLSYDLRDAASDDPTLTVSYIKDPEGAYTALSPNLAEVTQVSPGKLRLNFPAEGIGIKIAQNNASADTRLYDLTADVHARELSRV